MNKKILIFSPSYQENSGGVVVLHKLCSILNKMGYQSSLHPFFESYILHKRNYVNCAVSFMVESIKSIMKDYKTNPFFETPVIYSTKDINWDEWVVIYPETVQGNPLGAKNIVRWLLHNPGYHTDNFFYGKGELYFKFNSAISDFDYPGSCTSNVSLKVIHYPFEFYNTQGVSPERSGTAYCIRKGKGKRILHDLQDSILIDEKSHKEVADIFKKVDTFISYDTLTAYSIFAALCGCESVVIPDDGVSIDQWYPDYRDRYGISYGFSNIEEASSTRHLVKPRIMAEHEISIKNVQAALVEIDAFF
jgi:hypothetical protein